MLRFTKTLEIALRKKDSRFSIEFWKGLGYAAAFHGGLFVIFRIATMPNLDHVHPILPVQVEIELGTPSTMAILPKEHLLHSPLQTSTTPTVEPFVASSFFQMKNASFYSKKGEDQRADFSEVETLEYAPLEHLSAEEP